MSVQNYSENHWNPIEEIETGPGDKEKKIGRILANDLSQYAEKELGIEYNPQKEDWKVYYSEEKDRVALVAPSWGGAKKILGSETAFKSNTRIDGGESCPDGREIRMAGSTKLNVNEGELRGAANYLKNNK